MMATAQKKEGERFRELSVSPIVYANSAGTYWPIRIEDLPKTGNSLYGSALTFSTPHCLIRTTYKYGYNALELLAGYRFSEVFCWYMSCNFDLAAHEKELASGAELSLPIALKEKMKALGLETIFFIELSASTRNVPAATIIGISFLPTVRLWKKTAEQKDE